MVQLHIFLMNHELLLEGMHLVLYINLSGRGFFQLHMPHRRYALNMYHHYGVFMYLCMLLSLLNTCFTNCVFIPQGMILWQYIYLMGHVFTQVGI